MSAEAGSSKSGQFSDSSFDAYNADIQNSVLKATKLAVALPADINFNRTVDNDFAQAINSCSGTALRLTNSLLELAGTNHVSASRIKGKRKLEDQEDVVDSFGTLVVDVLDQLFEHADMSLDEYFGRTKPVANPVKPPPSVSTAPSSTRQGRLDPSLLHAVHLPKPQLKFKRKVDNCNESDWTPNLKHKYNAQVPLGYVLHDPTKESEDAVFGNSTSQNPHPYYYEIKHISYSQHMFNHRDAISPPPFDNTPFTWVDTNDGLDSLLNKLRHVEEIAVDLEHHSYRSFSGFLCLMQISTREEDFILDTLALGEELEELNEVFTDPRIVKVFHGAESDIIWLQQDFNIYVVNLFDTYHASKLLDFPKHGLGALLEMYCDFVPDKRYQLADWRIRPLPTEMLNYARSDTHFLLYIYDSLRNALLDRAGGQPNLVQSVLDRSQETSLRVYEREVYDMTYGNGPGGWNTLAVKWGRALSGMPREVFRAVHAWRDAVARREDESTRYVLPNHYLFQLAERPPAEMASLLRVFHPAPPLVRTKAASLLHVIRDAVREAPTKIDTGEKSEGMEPQHTTMNDTPVSVSRTQKPDDAFVRSESTSMRVEKTIRDLWTRQSRSLAAVSSSLLGSKSNSTKLQAVDHSSARSTHFPIGWIPAKSTNADAGDALTRYQDVVSRIHSNLALAPSMPVVPFISPEIKSAKTVVCPADATTFTAELGQIEIPFVPAALRQPPQSATIKAETVDTIVVVGRAPERKRKRSKQQGNASEVDKGDGVKKAKGEAAATVGGSEAVEAKPEEFDYASAPNFLDEPIKDTSVVLKPPRGKASKGRRAFEYGNFPAPPRAYNEVKGANKSHTFKG